jgi:putative transcriptional regulator
LSGSAVATPTRSVTGQDGRVDLDELGGCLLVASPLLTDPPFARTVVALLEHGRTAGALGVVLNRPLPTPAAELVPVDERLLSPPGVLFDGGPVGPTTAIALGLPVPGARPSGWTPSAPPYVTVDLDADVDALAHSLRQLRVFAGYAGWGAGQLEAEIRQGAWYVVDGHPDDVFAPAPAALWRQVLRRQGWPLAAVATCPVDPRMN